MRRLVALCVVALALLAAPRAGADPTQCVGKDAQDFDCLAVAQLEQTRSPLATYRGRLVMLLFLNTWSDHSVAAVPHLNKLHDEVGPSGLTILAVSEEEASKVAEWLVAQKANFGFAQAETNSYQRLRNFYAHPGEPWSYLVSPEGKVVWQGHPQSIKPKAVLPYAVHCGKAPKLPVALTEQQKLLDDGTWGAAHAALKTVAAEAGALSKTDQAWAVGVAAWIETRTREVFQETAALEAAGAFWDAWQIYDDYPRRFEGLAGVEDSKAKAAAVRADPAAKDDLEAGDRVANARELIAGAKGASAKNDLRRARLVLERTIKQFPGTSHAVRSKELLDSIP